jgi:alpha-beta hydrolase superfamily lysophospholipase
MPREPSERHFKTHDNVELFYRHWPHTQSPARGAVLLFHRGHEHSGRMAHLVDELNLPNFDFFAWDARGHGRSPGVRGFSPSLGTTVRDIQTFVEHLNTSHGVATESIFVIAQSVGAVLVSTWVHDYAPKLRGMTLASPAFKVKLYVPFARGGLKLLHRLRGNFFVNSYVKARFLTHDPERAASYDADPLIARPISVNILLGLYDAADRVVADAQAITVPTQLLISGADWVVQQAPQRKFFDRLGSAIKVKLELPGFYHDTLGERERAPVVAAIRAFALQLFDQPVTMPELHNAHVAGYTFEESRTLTQPLSLLTPRGLYWALGRASIRLGAYLSRGLRLGAQTGFDSGSTLDYVYRNQPEGSTALGRAIDRTYLQSIGWRGIRVRKVHVEELLIEAMRRVAASGSLVRVMDIAAGHGRYVLDAVLGSPVQPASILLRDYSRINVEQGQTLIQQKGLTAIARFEEGDAFAGEALARVMPRPNVGVVSGLYELFPDNEPVIRSLAGLSEAIPNGGYLVYTGQPWHPQLEMIARTLTSHRQNQAWVMRRRTQAEMDQLVERAGFRKLTQRVDEWGIFTVSLAQRVA